MSEINLKTIAHCVDVIRRETTTETEAIVRLRFLLKELDKVPFTKEENNKRDYVSFRNFFAKKVGFPEGDEHGWRKRFIELTKYNEGHLTKWRKLNKVPLEAFKEVENIDVSKMRARTQYVRWSDEEIETLRGYTVEVDGKIKLAPGHTFDSVAADLSEKFGRYLNDNSIKSKVNVFRVKRKTTKPTPGTDLVAA